MDALDGEQLAIASNKPARFLDRIVAGLGIGARFVRVLGGDSLDVGKPDPGVLRHVIGALPEPPDEVWMVGDSAIDMQTGAAAGARTIGCTWGLRGASELREAGAELLAEHPDDITAQVLGG